MQTFNDAQKNKEIQAEKVGWFGSRLQLIFLGSLHLSEIIVPGSHAGPWYDLGGMGIFRRPDFEVSRRSFYFWRSRFRPLIKCAAPLTKGAPYHGGPGTIAPP